MKLFIFSFVFHIFALFNDHNNIYHINNIHNIDQDILTTFTSSNLAKFTQITLLSLPIIYRNGDKCYNDDDCPHIMRCCQICFYKYCCTPNNYIKLEPAFIKNYVMSNNIKE